MSVGVLFQVMDPGFKGFKFFLSEFEFLLPLTEGLLQLLILKEAGASHPRTQDSRKSNHPQEEKEPPERMRMEDAL